GWPGDGRAVARMPQQGSVIGGLGPRAAPREPSADVDRVDSTHCERMDVGREVARAIATGIAQNEATGTARAHRPTRADGAPDAVASTATPEPLHGGITDDIELPEPDPAEAEEARLAADALALRRQQALAALREQVRPDPAQLDAIQGVVDEMNAELAAIAGDLLALVESGEEPTRLDWMIFAADFLDVFIDAETGLAGALSDEQ